uniref:Uncharacterized protein n=1 Tax=Anguilla anguilla TaxID=7936 RepID=A0A0E9SFQ3_ANGAN
MREVLVKMRTQVKHKHCNLSRFSLGHFLRTS